MRKTWLVAVFFLTMAVFGDVVITFHDGSIFRCSRVVREEASVIIVEKDGRQVSIQKRLVQSVDKGEKKTEAAPSKQAAKPEKSEKEQGDKLILTDDNVERTVPRKRPGEEKKEEKAPEAPKVTINVVSQRVTREGSTVKFEGTIRNDMTETVNSLRMTVQAVDKDGNVYAETASQVAASIAVGETAPFSFQFQDPDTKIARFAFRFEGITGGTTAQ